MSYFVPADLTKLTHEYAISPYFILKYAEDNGGIVSIIDSKKKAVAKQVKYKSCDNSAIRCCQ